MTEDRKHRLWCSLHAVRATHCPMNDANPESLLCGFRLLGLPCLANNMHAGTSAAFSVVVVVVALRG